MASLFSACKNIMLYTKQSGDYIIGENTVSIEFYTQEAINSTSVIGDSDEEKIVLFADKTITIPKDYILTPASPKKSLVIYCDILINNGTISMYQKAPNVLPHDFFLIGTDDQFSENVIIPAYADNSKTSDIPWNTSTTTASQHNGIDGTNRNCGSGGLGSALNQSGTPSKLVSKGVKSGSGYAFGGGAGSGGVSTYTGTSIGSSYIKATSANETYPMRGGNGYQEQGYFASGGVGNPKGNNTSAFSPGILIDNNFGCGGRIVIFCNQFINNGTITVNGTAANIGTKNAGNCIGGASGAGAVDVFYLSSFKQGTITANGGAGGRVNTTEYPASYNTVQVGAGGNGSITVTKLANNILKKEVKYFSQANVAYLLTQMSDRIKESHMGE